MVCKVFILAPTDLVELHELSPGDQAARITRTSRAAGPGVCRGAAACRPWTRSRVAVRGYPAAEEVARWGEPEPGKLATPWERMQSANLIDPLPVLDADLGFAEDPQPEAAMAQLTAASEATKIRLVWVTVRVRMGCFVVRGGLHGGNGSEAAVGARPPRRGVALRWG
jgi:hypothetical protein